jgi:hypothetical protein
MVRNKRIGAASALIAGVLGVVVSSASARPELQVGTRFVQEGSAVDTQAQSLDPTEPTVAEESDAVAADSTAQPVSN